MELVAALPMYNLTRELAASWQDLLYEFGRRIHTLDQGYNVTRAPSDESNLDVLWRRRDLALSQTCGYPLTHGLSEQVHVIGAPIFDAPGCHSHFYSSALVVRRTDAESTLDAYRDRVAAYNDDTSHSGMNALRHTFAPFARDGRFFATTVKTGSHLNSLKAVVDGRADIAAIDCVTLAFARDHLPHLTEPLRVLSFTRAAPGLPFIASTSLEPGTLRLLASTLVDIIDSHRALAGRLRLRALAPVTFDAYRPILEMEAEAARAGYSQLA